MKFNKLMSLLMGAAVISSVVPTTTANAAIKLQALEGTIYDAKAFKDGVYVFDGYKGEEQDSAMYFFNGKEDVEIEDAETMGSKYGMNYINFKDDEILFNLVTGQAEEDDEETRVSMMENKFRSSVIKKADRYENTPYLIQVGKIAEDIFSGVWYEYVVANSDDLDDVTEKYTVYLSDSGKYVDASETLNVVYYDKDGNKINLDTYEDVKKNKNLSVVEEETLLIDAENIYKVIAIMDTDKLKAGMNPLTTYALKVSMEQGEKEDGAYIPKSVTSYETYDLNALETIEDYRANKLTARVSGNSLYIIKTEDDSVTVDRYIMKKIKDKDSVEGKSLDKRVLELDEDFDDVQNEDMQDYDIDVQGNLWVLNKGKVQKLENGKLETKYTVDRTMDNLSVFAENSMIIWNTDNEVYSVVAPQKAVEEEKTEESVEGTESKDEVQTVAGWNKNSDGTWSYTKVDGTKANGWLMDNNTWYYLNSEGVMQTGWIKDKEQWYYLDISGAMHTGWLKDTNGKWYYLYNNGAMAYNTVIDGYTLDASGAWIQ
ncbi:MAG: Cell wall binding repeat protein [Clostridium butyricum DORA_1]|nr:MAG: Cell wall binding repeat protein [Clostridium butyricum DORA_1]MDU1509744.1 N-acetylmuramoyl-L-alanine amidase family protein [Clostridium butyricum]MDU4802912.1 N-acetylmuramoyl-L-alanine amidase family protein [Clostridium butyricum]